MTQAPKLDVSKLSRKEKLELITLLDEQERRKRAAKPQFAPFAEQLPILMSQALERYLFCGNGFGKSTILVNELHWAATGYNPVTKTHSPVPATIYLVVDDPGKIEQIIIPEYRKWNTLSEEQIHKDGKPYPARFTFDTGSVIHVVTHEVNLLKLEGVQMDYIFFDEPPPRHVFIGLRRGGRKKGRPLKILLAGTPLYQPWLRTDVHEKWAEGKLKNVECFFGETDANPYLEDDYKEQFGAFLTEEERLIRFKGMFAGLSGLALAALWDERRHVVKREGFHWDPSWPTVIAMDPHPSKAHYAVKLGVDSSGYLYVLDEYSEKALARKFMERLIELGWFEGCAITDIVFDSLGSADTTSGEGFKAFGVIINEVLAEHGLGRARATTYDDKSDEDFVERIRDSLCVPKEEDNFGQRIPKLRVLEGLRGIISNIRNVQWLRNRLANENKPKLDIGDKDYLACLKYALACNLYPKKRKDKVYYRSEKVYGVELGSSRAKVKKFSRFKGSRPKARPDREEW